MGGSWGDRYCAGNQDFVVGANAQQQAVQIEGGDLKIVWLWVWKSIEINWFNCGSRHDSTMYKMLRTEFTLVAVHVRQVTMGLKTISISASQHDTLKASIAWDRPSGVMVAGEM